MANITLTRTEVAAKYEATGADDKYVHVPGYSGKLSRINIKGAENLIKSKSRLLVEKPSKQKKDVPENNSLG